VTTVGQEAIQSFGELSGKKSSQPIDGSSKTYIQDDEAEGDQELVEFFSAVLENNLEAAQRAKEMLVPRFQREQE
jgi:hypothetical protein